MEEKTMIRMNCRECGYVKYSVDESMKEKYKKCDSCGEEFIPIDCANWKVLKANAFPDAEAGVTKVLKILGLITIVGGIIGSIVLGSLVGTTHESFFSDGSSAVEFHEDGIFEDEDEDEDLIYEGETSEDEDEDEDLIYEGGTSEDEDEDEDLIYDGEDSFYEGGTYTKTFNWLAFIAGVWSSVLMGSLLLGFSKALSLLYKNYNQTEILRELKQFELMERK